MSYLTGPRLNFTGKFIADVSTVNNFPANYDRPAYTAKNYDNWDIGYWNPYGTGVWRLTDCVVTNALFADGGVAAGDPIIGMAVADANDQPPAKMVDLDPEQQMASAIWGLLVRLVGKNGAEAVRGTFATASFTDLWARSWAQDPTLPHPLHPPSLLGACWQSVLTDPVWGDLGGSPFLKALANAAGGGPLSIKFNVYGYNAGYADNGQRFLPNPPDFTIGRLTGSIGIAGADEPRHFTLGRKLQPPPRRDQKAPAPFNYCTAVVNEERRVLTIDLGNAIPFKEWQGPLVAEPLRVGFLDQAGIFQPLGAVAPNDDWYRTTAGIGDFALTDQQLAIVATRPLAVHQASTGTILASEPADGRFVRADQFVFRLSPDDKQDIALWATRFGKPLPDSPIALAFDPSALAPNAGDPATGTPESALVFAPVVTTDANGKATLTVTARNPGEPRKADDIDGQIYAVRPGLVGAGPGGYANTWDFISFLVWSGYEIPDAPTWEQDIKPILLQYANLYPAMRPAVDMGDYRSVVKNRQSLSFAMSLPEEHPNHMPVVRDLSPAKRTTILKWAAEEQPLFGEPAATATAGPPGSAARSTARPRK